MRPRAAPPQHARKSHRRASGSRRRSGVRKPVPGQAKPRRRGPVSDRAPCVDAVAAARAADDAMYEAERRARIAAGARPVCAIDCFASERKHVRQANAFCVEVAALRARKAQAEKDCGVAEAREAAADAKFAERVVEREIWETRAATLEGLRAKARTAKIDP